MLNTEVVNGHLLGTMYSSYLNPHTGVMEHDRVADYTGPQGKFKILYGENGKKHKYQELDTVSLSSRGLYTVEADKDIMRIRMTGYNAVDVIVEKVGKNTRYTFDYQYEPGLPFVKISFYINEDGHEVMMTSSEYRDNILLAAFSREINYYVNSLYYSIDKRTFVMDQLPVTRQQCIEKLLEPEKEMAEHNRRSEEFWLDAEMVSWDWPYIRYCQRALKAVIAFDENELIV